MSNFVTKAMIQITGITSSKVALLVDDNSSFSIGEVIIGVNSQTTGVITEVRSVTTPIYGVVDALILKNRDGFFDEVELITGSLGGSTNSIGTYFFTESYLNDDLGIDGFWNIETTGDLLVSIDDSVRKIDISKGGNYATGYTFGFTLANFELVNDLRNDGVFLQNLPVRYFIDFGSGYVPVWTGIIDTYPKVGSVDAKFTCIDSMKLKSQKIGSDEIPICLNQNYNCKLVKETEVPDRIIYDFSDQFGKYYEVNGSDDINKKTVPDGAGFTIISISDELNCISIYTHSGSGWQLALTGESAKSLRVVGGPSTGTILNIVKNEFAGIVGGRYVFNLYLDSSVTSLSSGGNSSYLELSSYSQSYRLSENDVSYIHKNKNNEEKPLRSYDNGKEFFINDERFLNYGTNSIEVLGLSDDGKISNSNETIPIVYIYSSDYLKFSDGSLSSFRTVVNSDIPLVDLNVITDSEDEVYINVGDFSFSIDDVTTTSIESRYITVSCVGYYNSNVIYDDGSTKMEITFFSEKFDYFEVEQVGDRVYIKLDEPQYKLKLDGFLLESLYSKVELKVQVSLTVTADKFFPGGYDYDFIYDSLSYVKKQSVDLETIGIGCNGENVTSGKYMSYPETIKYIDLTYNGIDISEIDTASYTQAEEDYNLFPSYTERNPAHQITEQTDFNDILKEMLYFSHLGLFTNRFGQRSLSNWLPKSTVFSDTPVESVYDESKYMSITDISRPRTIKIISDYELKYDYSEAEGEEKKSIRIKSTDSGPFVLKDKTEGVTSGFYKEAEQAWILFGAGYNRTKTFSQTVVESKWIKDLGVVNSNESEAINFIRNQAGHINREHERVTITLQLNETDAIKELLSFDSVYHLKKTDDEARKGWIVESRISWRSKTIKFTYLLDISLKDPFLYRIGIIQDNSTVDDIIVNDETATDIINDGAGI